MPTNNPNPNVRFSQDIFDSLEMQQSLEFFGNNFFTQDENPVETIASNSITEIPKKHEELIEELSQDAGYDFAVRGARSDKPAELVEEIVRERLEKLCKEMLK